MDITRTDFADPPAWVQDAVFYQIFPDRFACSPRVRKPSNLEPWDSPPTIHGFKGGDLIGVADKLDYLQDLGITAVYLCPVFRSDANHRYHTQDYDVVDPILGGNRALATLLEEMHRRGLKLILDGVFNHASRGFYQFSSLLANGKQCPYLDWWCVESWPLHPYGPADQPPGYRCWWGNRELPEFNTDTPAVREFLWDVGQRWIQLGIDGWRLDVPNEIDDDAFWQEFRRRVRAAGPDSYIVGEIWGDARRWLTGDQFDAVMNYLFTRACLGFFTNQRGLDGDVISGTGLDPTPALDVSRFAETVEWVANLYPQRNVLAQLNLLDSHDTPRFLTIANGDVSALRLALIFEMVFPGAPCVYYGDEIGMTGGKDPDNRRGFDWNRTNWNEELLAGFKDAIALRRDHEALRRGTFRTLHAENGIYVCERRLGDSLVIAAFNTNAGPQRIDVDVLDGVSPAGLRPIHGSQVPEVEKNALRAWLIPGRDAAVIVTGSGQSG